MARDYAQIRSDIWADDHWRSLTPGAQWLYMHLLTSPTLTHAGVADWRPARISKLARTIGPESVRKYADELQRERFILTDDETEEVAIRSFIRHDGVLLNPNMWKSLGAAFADIYSAPIKALVAHEVARLRSEHPEGLLTTKGGRVNPWESRYLQTLIKSGSDTPSDTPSRRGSDTGSPPTPTPTPRNASHSSARAGSKSREVALPKGWAPTAEHIKRAQDARVDVITEAETFRLHAETHDRRAVNWNAAFTMWLKKAKPSTVQTQDDIRDGILFRNGKPVVGGPNGMTPDQYREWMDRRAS